MADNTYGTVASMAIPAGRWFITAKGYLQSTPDRDRHVPAGRRLGLAHHDDRARAELRSGGGQWQSFVLMTTHRFTSPGTARLRCQSNFQTGDVLVRYIRITAMQVGKLTTHDGRRVPTTVGSGKPEVRALSGDAQVQLNGGMVLHDVASLSLPAGLWWITAAA